MTFCGPVENSFFLKKVPKRNLQSAVRVYLRDLQEVFVILPHWIVSKEAKETDT